MAEEQKPQDDHQMTSSSNIIDSVLDNLKSLIGKIDHELGNYAKSDSEYSKYYIWKLKLMKVDTKFVRTFVLCARRFSIYGWKHAGLEPCLSGLRDTLILYPAQIFDALTQHRASKGYDFDPVFNNLEAKFEPFIREISTMYCSLRDFESSSSHDSALTTADGVLLEFVDSMLENLVDKGLLTRAYSELLKPIQEKLRLLKDFILFATWQGIEYSLLRDSVSYLQHVAFQAADLLYRCHFGEDLNTEDIYNQMIPEVYRLHETWVQGLMASEFSGPILQTLNLEKDVRIVGDFTDSLADLLWEVLNHERGFTVVKKDKMQMLYDGLRFLRTILKKQPEKFNGLHHKMKDFVGFVVNKAGILVLECSLSLNSTGKLDLESSDVLQKVKLIQLVTSTFKSPRTNGIGFIKFLLKNLRELAELDFIAHSKNQIWMVQKEFVILESFLEKISQHHNVHDKFLAFRSRVIEVAEKVMFVVHSFDISSLSFSSKILDELQLLRMETKSLEVDETFDSEVKVEKTSVYVSSQGFIPKVNIGTGVGFKDEIETMIDRVTHGSKKLVILSIVGMPGLGKTTLARRVYSNPSIINHFDVRAWCNVSQAYDMKGLLLEILGCINPENSRQYSRMDEEDLAPKLRNSLQRRRYFIILDDVWDIDAWKILKRSFPDDANGSRILITTRLYDLASQVQVDSEPHRLRQFTDDESWDLLQKMLFPNGSWPPELCTVGKQIAQNCGGLPLTVVIVAGILATTSQDGWKEFAGRTTRRTVISSIDQSMDMLELSYRHVPDYLKPCLLYVGAFPQGQAIPIVKLLQLWIAEGFVQKVMQKNIDEVAKDYMMDLVGRSLIMVAERSHILDVERCRIHDLIHEFCATKAKGENFFQSLHGYDELYAFSESDNTRRLCIYSETEHFEKSRLFCPFVGSLIFSSPGVFNPTTPETSFSIFKFCQRLRVLDLEKIDICGAFPTELLVVVELRYLAIGGDIESIPSSIASLSNLETFTLGVIPHGVELPEIMWNMTNLRHLKGVGHYGNFYFPKDMPENSTILYNLSTFSSLKLFLDPSMEKILSKFPNIRTMACELYEPEEEALVLGWSKDVRMDFLSQLESLDLTFHKRCDIQFYFPLNLKKLVLYQFSWCMISAIEKLSNLEELRLLSDLKDSETVSDAIEEEEISEDGERSDHGEVGWDVTEEVEFPKLKILHLSNLEIVRWTGSGDHFPCLQTLSFYCCRKLEELPSCLGYNSPLEMIEIRGCKRPLVECAKGILEEQLEEMGNERLQICTFGDNE